MIKRALLRTYIFSIDAVGILFIIPATILFVLAEHRNNIKCRLRHMGVNNEEIQDCKKNIK